MAETINFKADLKASSEVPPNDSKGSGFVTATYDSASKKLSYKGNYSGLTAPATAAEDFRPPVTDCDHEALRRAAEFRRTARS